MKIKIYISILFYLSLFFKLAAQAPANDNCIGATVLPSTCLVPQSASTIGATLSAGLPPSCTSTDYDDDIWYKITATSGSWEFTISNAQLENGDPAAIGMAVQEGPCGDPYQIFCSNNIATGDGKVTVSGLNIGTTYTIRFWTTGTSQKGTFDFCYSDPSIVPVKITDYKIVCHNGMAEIAWTTTYETNNQYFRIEKSTNGQNYTTVGKVNAALNGANGHAYSFTDPGINKGATFYRIVQVDKDGHSFYYKILESHCQEKDGKDMISIIPNPVYQSLNIQNSGNFKINKVKIFDINNRIIIEAYFDPAHPDKLMKISVSFLESGLYFLQVSDLKGNEQTLRFFKH